MAYSTLDLHQINEIIDHLILLDDIFFSAVFDGRPKEASILLNILLEKDDINVVDVKTQYSIDNLYGKSVRFDLFATDDKGRQYDVEIQREVRGASALRARYYASLIDVAALRKGADYKELPETYVIFISEKNVLKSCNSQTHIERVILESEQSFGDCQHILYVNGEIKDGSLISHLMEDLMNEDYRTMHIPELAEVVKFYKTTLKGRETMNELQQKFFERKAAEVREEALAEGLSMGISQGIEQGISQGIEQGISQGIEQGISQGIEQGISQGVAQVRNDIVTSMIGNHFSVEKISAVTGIPLDVVKKIATQS